MYAVDDLSNSICLKIRSNTSLNAEEGFKFSLDSEKMYHFTSPQIFQEPEIFDEGYILQLLNDSFIKFTNKTKLLV